MKSLKIDQLTTIRLPDAEHEISQLEDRQTEICTCIEAN